MSLSAARSYGHTPRKLPRWASNLPHHRSAPFDRRLIIVQQERPGSQGLFCAKPKVFSRFSVLCAKGVCATSRRDPLPEAEGLLLLRISPVPILAQGATAPARRWRCAASPAADLNTPRPSRPCAWRACRSRRTRRSASPAGKGCTGRKPPPPPSSSAHIPVRRTTWSWRSRPGSPSFP